MPVLLNGKPIYCERCLGRIYPTEDPEDWPYACICGARFDKDLHLVGWDKKKFKKRTGLSTNQKGGIGWRGSNELPKQK
jgi:hypothetical protein